MSGDISTDISQPKYWWGCVPGRVDASVCVCH